jgi:hypothetical protein
MGREHTCPGNRSRARALLTAIRRGECAQCRFVNERIIKEHYLQR